MWTKKYGRMMAAFAWRRRIKFQKFQKMVPLHCKHQQVKADKEILSIERNIQTTLMHCMGRT